MNETPRFYELQIRTASYILRLRAKNSRDDVSHAIPLLGFGLETSAACGSELVIFGTAVVLAVAPLAGNHALMLEAIERWVQRTLLNYEFLARDLLDAKQHSVAMQRAERNCLQN